MVRTKKAKILAIICTLGMLATMFIVPFTASAATAMGVSYNVHGQSYGTQAVKSNGELAGTVGASKRVEAIAVALTNPVSAAAVSYQVYQGKAWTTPVSSGFAGVTGKSLMDQKFRLTLSGAPGYALEYRVQGQSYGWTAWATVQNGTALASAPSLGTLGKRIEAVEIKVVAVVAPTTATSVSAINSTIAVGGTTGFTFADANKAAVTPTGVVYTVTSANAATGYFNNGVFTATAAGAYTINAAIGSTNLTTIVNVSSGVVTGVKFSTVSSPIVANEASVEKITVQAVDASGLPVASFNGSATLVISGSNASQYFASSVTSPAYGTSPLGASTKLSFTNGVATIQVIGGPIAGLTDTLTLNSLVDSNNVAVTNYTSTAANFTTVAQVATSIKVTAPAFVSANTATTTSAISYEVDDQAGDRMISGVYGITVGITGAANFYPAGNQTAQTLSYNGAVTADPTDTLISVTGIAGTTTITASATGLKSGSATIQSAIAGNQSKLTVANANSSATSNDFVTGSAGQSYTVSTVDANNVPTGAYTNHNVVVYITKADGTAATNLIVGATNESTSGVSVLSTSGFMITDTAANDDVGTYTVAVKDPASSPLTAAATFTFNVTASTASKVAFSTVNNYVSAANPTTTVKAQIEDMYGNAVADSGVSVLFSTTGLSGSEAAFNGGTLVATPTVTITTDSTGLATTTFTAQSYNGTWPVSAYASSLSSTSNGTITVENNPVASLAISLTASTGSSSQVVASTTFSALVAEKDAYGNSITSGENDNVKVTLSNANAIVWPTATTGASIDSTAGTITGTVSAVNTYLTGLTAKQAGAVSFTVTDTSVTATSATAGITVLAGGFSKYVLANTSGVLSGTNEVTVVANTSIALTLEAVDAEGNIVVSNAAHTVNLTIGSITGNFEAASGGAAITSVSFGDGVPSITVYYINGTAGTYDLSGSSVVTFAI